MANDSGINTSELQEALANATTEEDRRYLERVLESRGLRKANVSSHEVVEGNPNAYPARTVEQQQDLADGRPHEPVPSADLGVRGSVEVPSDDGGGGTKSPRSSKK